MPNPTLTLASRPVFEPSPPPSSACAPCHLEPRASIKGWDTHCFVVFRIPATARALRRPPPWMPASRPRCLPQDNHTKGIEPNDELRHDAPPLQVVLPSKIPDSFMFLMPPNDPQLPSAVDHPDEAVPKLENALGELLTLFSLCQSKRDEFSWPLAQYRANSGDPPLCTSPALTNRLPCPTAPTPAAHHDLNSSY